MSRKRPNILIGALSCGEKTGGAALSAMLIADLISTDCDVSVLTASNETQRSDVHELRLGSVRAAVPMLVRLPTQLLGLERQVLRVIEQVRPDLIHLQDANLMDPVVPLARRLRIPVIVTLRDLMFVPSFRSSALDSNGTLRPAFSSRGKAFLDLFELRRPLTWSLPFLLPLLYAKPKQLRTLMQQSTLLLPVSDFVRRELELLGVTAPMEVQALEPVPDWPLQSMPVRESGEINFLYVGRLVAGKGVEVLLDSFSIVSRSFPKATLTIAGDGPRRRELEHQADALGVGSGTRFIGHVPHSLIDRVYQQADIVVFPSIYPESTGRSALEAFMLGRPVIAARSGGLVDVIGENRGVLVRPGDVGELAREMISLAGDRERRLRLAQAGREYATRFTAHNLRKELLQMYDRFLPSKVGIDSEQHAAAARM